MTPSDRGSERGRSRALERILRYLAGFPAARLARPRRSSFPLWWKQVQGDLKAWREPPDLALAGGFLAPCVGYAFAAGYQAALRSLIARLPGEQIACLSVTEEEGGHPRAIKARLEPDPVGAGGEGASWVLSGKKRWATLGQDAETIFLAASIGRDPAGRNQIRLMRLEPRATGVTIRPMPPTPFMPEIAHAEILLDRVTVSADQLLPGDGYTCYIKPFRTVEDTHVNAAILGYLLQVARRSDWPTEVTEEILGLVVTLRSLALADPDAAVVHVALGGFFHAEHRLLESLEPHWRQVDPAVGGQWERDKRLLGIAGGARAKRLETAWRRLASDQG